MKTQSTVKSGDLVLGIMSGTSLDGVDYVLCKVGPKDIKFLKHWHKKYPKALQNKLMNCATNKISSYEFSQLHHDLGRFYAEAAPKTKCHYVGLHGQTVFHNPSKKNAATLQLGESVYLAEKLGMPVINNFRVKDMALGGQGAPLATLFHVKAFGSLKQNVAVNNLGGISNVTFIPKGANTTNKQIQSFDTGPANMLIDEAVKKITHGRMTCDIGGKIASQGLMHRGLINKWLKHKYFNQKPPKSTGREEFGPKFFEKVWNDCKKTKLTNNDIVATLTGFTAHAIAESYAKFLPVLPDKVILCGGGAANPVLTTSIRRALREVQLTTKSNHKIHPIEVITSDECGWDPQTIEAAAFALLAYQTWHLQSGNLPQTTGAKSAGILGQLTWA